MELGPKLNVTVIKIKCCRLFVNIS